MLSLHYFLNPIHFLDPIHFFHFYLYLKYYFKFPLNNNNYYIYRFIIVNKVYIKPFPYFLK